MSAQVLYIEDYMKKKSYSYKASQYPITREMLDATREELSRKITSVDLTLKAFQTETNAKFESLELKMDARFERIEAKIDRMLGLYEEQRNNNNIIAEQKIEIDSRLDRVEGDVKDLQEITNFIDKP